MLDDTDKSLIDMMIQDALRSEKRRIDVLERKLTNLEERLEKLESK